MCADLGRAYDFHVETRHTWHPKKGHYGDLKHALLSTRAERRAIGQRRNKASLVKGTHRVL